MNTRSMQRFDPSAALEIVVSECFGATCRQRTTHSRDSVQGDGDDCSSWCCWAPAGCNFPCY